ncbi:MAG: UPF0280 family protein [Methanomicrobiales archaeon]|nr:UPF0280 family protein [Methanomicrobiales archaeon]
MIRRHFQYRETIATLLADEEIHITAGIEGMLGARREIEQCIAHDPFFVITYEPYHPSWGGETVSRMVAAADGARVGPMAAVAGAIAWAGVEAMVNAGADCAVIDNGGDIALTSDRPIRVGIHAGTAPLSNQLAFIIPPQEKILGICTSSATVGHSVSFGVADAVTVFSHDIAAADAWATAICNVILPDRTEILQTLAGSSIDGVMVIIGEQQICWGDLPPLVKAHVDEELITRGRAVLTGAPQYTSVPGDRTPDR